MFANQPSFSLSRGQIMAALSLLVTFAVFVWGSPSWAQEKFRVMTMATATGTLSVPESPASGTYTIYFHVPVETKNQVPLYLKVWGYGIKDYRIIRTTGHNVLVAAQLYATPYPVTISWSAWVLLDANYFPDIPYYLPMPMVADLPDSVLPFLQATATSQNDCAPVQEWVDDNPYLNNLPFAAELVCERSHDIPQGYSHSPISFDAHYAMLWGSSCTGHAHVTTALLRKLGIPARTKLVMLTYYEPPLDMHYSTDYFIPDYGWVGMDGDMNVNPRSTVNEVIVYSCDVADEFPLFLTHGIEGFWHSSDKSLGVATPGWTSSHVIESSATFNVTDYEKDRLMELAREAFNYEIDFRGGQFPASEIASLEECKVNLNAAKNQLLSNNAWGAITELEAVVNRYQSIDGGVEASAYASDFEDGASGWSHGGTVDEWELGVPTSTGPPTAHSGSQCWGTDLDDAYDDNSNSWLLSPSIDLTGYYSAELEFWIWNKVQGRYAYINGGDHVWMEISTDGTEFLPFCSAMRGGSSDPEIPVVSGWARMDLDLSPYVGETVQFRFHFLSDAANTWPGSYIDDVIVTGRKEAASSVYDEIPQAANSVLTQLDIYPNPFNPQTSISFELAKPLSVRVDIFDMAGKAVVRLADREFAAGSHVLVWDGRDQMGGNVSSGSYLLHVEAGQQKWQGKMMLVR